MLKNRQYQALKQLDGTKSGEQSVQSIFNLDVHSRFLRILADSFFITTWFFYDLDRRVCPGGRSTMQKAGLRKEHISMVA